jgi:phosphoglycerate dehydrogenase-like enzyme
MRVAVLDDYQDVALSLADWSRVRELGDVDRFTDHLPDPERLVERLAPYDVVVLMRERTPFPAQVIDRLPGLRLVVTTGRRNASIDVEAARRRGVVVCGTGSLATAPAELTWALILAWSRNLVVEAGNVREGRWQSTLGRDLAGRTLGVVGLGRIGVQVATVGRAFGMQVLAWSRNLTQQRADEVGVRAVPLPDLLAGSDVVTVHQVLSDRTRGLLGDDELARMKADALLVNTSRAPIVDVDAVVAARRAGRLGGAALDVFHDEPLAPDDPLRTTPGLLLTPHLGYVTEAVYRRFFGEAVEDILAFARGEPIRTL